MYYASCKVSFPQRIPGCDRLIFLSNRMRHRLRESFSAGISRRNFGPSQDTRDEEKMPTRETTKTDIRNFRGKRAKKKEQHPPANAIRSFFSRITELQPGVFPRKKRDGTKKREPFGVAFWQKCKIDDEEPWFLWQIAGFDENTFRKTLFELTFLGKKHEHAFIMSC